jgi:hypothetical protein
MYPAFSMVASTASGEFGFESSTAEILIVCEGRFALSLTGSYETSDGLQTQ